MEFPLAGARVAHTGQLAWRHHRIVTKSAMPAAPGWN